MSYRHVLKLKESKVNGGESLHTTGVPTFEKTQKGPAGQRKKGLKTLTARIDFLTLVSTLIG